MKKRISMLFFVMAVTCALSFTAFAEEDVPEYTEGVTVTADDDSPTGYTVTFVYKNEDAENVQLAGQLFYFFTLDEGSNVKYEPEEWTSDMFSMWANNEMFTRDMEKVGDDIWTLSIPLPSGGYQYHYTVDGESSSDPANPPLTNTLSGDSAKSSMVYVPYDSEKQADDQSAEVPLEGENGTLIFDAVPGDESDRNLAIYLPYGYEADSEEAYKVIYLAHGGGGSELDWMNEGCVPNIMDNLISDGESEPMVVVSMFNEDLDGSPEVVMESILPYVEENYNVSAAPEDRAIAGYSLGGKLAAQVYLAYPEEFGYIGLWSVSQDLTAMARDEDKDLNFANVMVGMGMYDTTIIEYGNIPLFISSLHELDIDYDFYTCGGSHDFNFWQRMFTIFVRDYIE